MASPLRSGLLMLLAGFAAVTGAAAQDGTLDPIFGGGAQTFGFDRATFATDLARAVAVQNDGAVVVAGVARGSATAGFRSVASHGYDLAVRLRSALIFKNGFESGNTYWWAR